MPKLTIFYSIEDYFPPYRVDIAELYGHSLKKYGIECVWAMQRKLPGACASDKVFDQISYLPYRSASTAFIGKLINKLAFWLCDIRHLGRCISMPLDVIQVRDKYIAGLVGLLIANIKGLPFMYWCSFPFPEHYLEMSKQSTGLRKVYCYLHGSLGVLVLYKCVMRFSNHVFVQSNQMRLDIAAYGVPNAKMSVVPMGVPQRLFDWANAQAIQVVAGRVVYLGTMAAVRQLHVLIDAFSIVAQRCPQASLLMIGDGDHAHERAALEAQVANLGLTHAVRFTGFVPIEEAWSMSASAAVCVSPFYPTKVLASTSPTKLVEYMALGRPVVCNNHPEQSSIIQQSGAGLCVEWGVQPFADAIITLLEDPTQAESMGAKGPAWVNANRTYSIIAEQVWRTYQRLVPTLNENQKGAP